MKTILYKSETRGHEDHGWLNAKHTFSFANYYDPERIHFGALRVINDDTIDGGMGFGTHAHDNMEIITIPLKGSLKHQDSLGHGGVINTGDIQVMSAGKGIKHSEYNAQKDEKVNLFQIWIFPDKKNVEPRYQQKTYKNLVEKNTLHEVVTPKSDRTDTLWIHQDAWFSIGTFNQNHSITYDLKIKENGVFAMIIEGSFKINGIELNSRDGLGIYDTENILIDAMSENAQILLIEVPLYI